MGAAVMESSALILGQAVSAHEGIVMALVTCRCQPDNVPILIRGTDLIVMCARCRKLYRIIKVEFDFARGDRGPMVTIAHVGTKPLEA